MTDIQKSELIINEDGSVYHLQVKPENIAHKIIFVGDQDRVNLVTKHFDSIEFSTQKREFKTTTGTYKGTRISVVSTGIGPDNIDIVLNELDALVNIDFATRSIKETFTPLSIVRVGTSGSLQKDIPVDAMLLSTHAIGIDNMLRSYDLKNATDTKLEDAFIAQTDWNLSKGRPYAVQASESLIQQFSSDEIYHGLTITAPGFYGAQGRVLRLALEDPNLNQKIDQFSYQEIRATNLEMETAAIYGLSRLLGHQALSLNAIVANRALGTFSSSTAKTIDRLILFALDKFVN